MPLPMLASATPAAALFSLLVFALPFSSLPAANYLHTRFGRRCSILKSAKQGCLT